MTCIVVNTIKDTVQGTNELRSLKSIQEDNMH